MSVPAAVDVFPQAAEHGALRHWSVKCETKAAGEDTEKVSYPLVGMCPRRREQSSS